MKKYIILALFLMPFAAFAQGALTSNTGQVFGLSVGKTSTADSAYAVGDVDMSNVDSVHIVFSATDSARVRIAVQAVTHNKTTDTVTAQIHPNAATYYGQLTAAGILTVPWHVIHAALEPYDTGIRTLRISSILYLTGTETYSGATADKQTYYVKLFKSR